jgi:RNA 2',3'-cyclic 3'-phosphodiesterase
MRAFIAIDLPPEIRRALGDVQSRFETQLRSRGLSDAGLRWTRADGIHLTLKFLGEISLADSIRVVELLRGFEPFEKFSVQVKGYGFFPDRRRPQVLWAGLVAQPALVQLASQIDRAMASIGFAAERRTYSPHLTLARFKIPRRQPVLEALLAEFGDEPVGQFEVPEFFLFESHLSVGSPAQYRKVARFPNLHPVTDEAPVAPIGDSGRG